MHLSEVSVDTRIFGSQFVDYLKQLEKVVLHKSILVAQNFRDEEARNIQTNAPTVRLASQRLAFPLAASHHVTTPICGDVSQAYTQIATNLTRDVYIRAPAELVLPPNTVLKVIKPLYGINKAVLNWYLTYIDRHITFFHMESVRQSIHCLTSGTS